MTPKSTWLKMFSPRYGDWNGQKLHIRGISNELLFTFRIFNPKNVLGPSIVFDFREPLKVMPFDAAAETNWMVYSSKGFRTIQYCRNLFLFDNKNWCMKFFLEKWDCFFKPRFWKTVCVKQNIWEILFNYINLIFHLLGRS